MKTTGHFIKIPVVGFGFFRVGLTNGAGFSTDYFERILLDNSAAPMADIQSIPSGSGFDLFAGRITGIKTVSLRFVTTKANPRITIAEFTGYKFLGHGFGITI